MKTINLYDLSAEIEAEDSFLGTPPDVKNRLLPSKVTARHKRNRLLVGYFVTLYFILVMAFFVQTTVAEAAGFSNAVPAATVTKPKSPTHGGLYFASPEKGKVIASPALKSDVHLEITGPVVRARVTQYFKNPTKYWLEGIYTFPLPETSGVDSLVMTIGERTVRGVIKPKELARKIYEKAASQGKRASLMDQQRANVFTTQVANIGPGEEIAITLEYQQVLSLKDGSFDLRFPMVIRPRYIPGSTIIATASTNDSWVLGTDQVPDAELITPPVQDPRLGKINPVNLTIKLNPGFPIENLTSNSHLINVVDNVDGSISVGLDTAFGETAADSDFVMKWQPQVGRAPLAGVFSERFGQYDYHLVMVMPPKELSVNVERNALPREVVYIMDKSGSMAGNAMDQAKAALISALNRGNPKDRFNVIAFESEAQSLWTRARAATKENIAEAIGFVKALEADGGTEMSGALDLALDNRVDKSLIRQIVFITDGAVGNEEALMAKIKSGLGSSKLFTVGIGAAPNSYFMTEAAEVGKGSYVYISYDQDLKGSMEALFQKLENPALIDISTNWRGGTRDQSVLMFPSQLPDLYVGDPLMFVARTPTDSFEKLELSGSIGATPWKLALDIREAKKDTGLHKVWARDYISQLERDKRTDYDNWEKFDADITKVALHHGLVSRLTSLVAVDDEVVRPEGEQLLEGEVATNLPNDMDPNFVTGNAATREAKRVRQQNFQQNQHKAMGLPPRAKRTMADTSKLQDQASTPAPVPGSANAPLRIDRSVVPTGKQVMLPAGALGWKLASIIGAMMMLLSLLIGRVLYRQGVFPFLRAK